MTLPCRQHFFVAKKAKIVETNEKNIRDFNLFLLRSECYSS